MDVRAVRDLLIALPGDEPDLLDPIGHVPRQGQAVSECLVSGEVWSRVELVNVTVSRSWFVNADLASLTLQGLTLDRCALRGCNLIGTRWENIMIKDVILENCLIDYAYFTDVKASGPVSFVGCSLTDATFTRGKLSTAAFDGCKLSGVTFDGCDLRGADLRGNDISGLVAATGLRGAILSQSQVPALTKLLINDLSIQIKPDPR